MGENGNSTWGKVLTGQQRLFVDYWFETNCNGTRAAQMAGYCPNGAEKDWASKASQLLTNVKVLEEINRRWSAHGVTAEEVIATLTKQMRAAPGDFMDEYGRIDLQAVKEGGRGIVKEVRIYKGNRVELKLECAQRAAELIGKTMGLFKETVEHKGQIDLVIDWDDANGS